MEINYLNAFNDNYIWLLQQGANLIVIDPGQSTQVLNYSITNCLNLQGILLTHDHADHIGGVQAIQAKYNQAIIYGRGKIATKRVNEHETIKLFNHVSMTTLFTPGHTHEGVCYLVKDNDLSHLFCGDTLFAAGCGRVFTNDFTAMFNSLQKIMALNKATLIYPAHEYTVKNLNFAKFIEPNNVNVLKRLAQAQAKLAQDGITLPTTLEVELLTNPFLRVMDLTLINSLRDKLGMNVLPGLDCFIKLRKLRDNF